MGYRITLYMRSKSLIEAVLIGCVLIWLSGCNKDAPVPIAATSSPYQILSEATDPQSGRFAIDIKVPQPTDEPRVKSVVESLINSRKSAHPQIIVRTYLESVGAQNPLYAVSILDGGQITHRFNSEAGQQRIPTH
jgi:hypothetical protein